MDQAPNPSLKYALAGTLLCVVPCLCITRLLPVVGSLGILAAATLLVLRRRGVALHSSMTPTRLWAALAASTLATALGAIPILNDRSLDEELESEQAEASTVLPSPSSGDHARADAANDEAASNETADEARATGDGPAAAAPANSADAPTQTDEPQWVQSSGPRDPLDDFLRNAVSVDEFDRRLADKEWAFFPRGVRSCESGEEPDYLPPGDDEFARRLAEQRRDGIRESLVGTVVRFEGRGTLAGTNPVFDTVDVGGGAFELYRSAYDFRAGAYTFHLVANSDLSGSIASWPLCTRGVCSPDIRPETFVSEVQRTIGTIGDREVRVRSSETDVEWQNFSRIAIRAPIPEADAARLGRNMPIDVLLLLRFEGLGFHQRCQRNCDVLFGERVCGGDEMGMGVFKKASLLGYRVKSGERVLATMVFGEGER